MLRSDFFPDSDDEGHNGDPSMLHLMDRFGRIVHPIETVWPKFTAWAEALRETEDHKLLLIAWNGTSSDMKWIVRLTSPFEKWKLK